MHDSVQARVCHTLGVWSTAKAPTAPPPPPPLPRKWQYTPCVVRHA
jgi:hypothetical protein